MRAIPVSFRVIAWLAMTCLTVWSWSVAQPVHDSNWSALHVSLEKGQTYRTVGSRRATLDIYRSTQTSNSPRQRLRPAVIAVHGGSWNGGSMIAYRYDSQKIVIRLAQQGVVVFAIDYRLSRPGSPSWPEVVDDLRAAVRWVRARSAEFGVDPTRIAVMGQSAGGHLAALLGTLPDLRDGEGVSSRVQAVVSFYAPYDLAGLMISRRLAHEPVRNLLGNTASPLFDRASEASPIQHVTKDDPPMLLIHGSDDAWVPLAQSVRMAAALATAGVAHRLIVVEGARHGFETLLESPARRDLLPEILAFLESVWNISSVAAATDSRSEGGTTAIRDFE